MNFGIGQQHFSIMAALIAAIGITGTLAGIGCGPGKSPIGAGPTSEHGNGAVESAALPTGNTGTPPPVEFVTTADGRQELHALGLAFAIGEKWNNVPPTNAMRVAQFELPAFAPQAANPAASGELVIFYFGPGQGGSAQENITRWIEQVSNRIEEGADSRTIGGLTVHRVMAVGTLQPTSMGGAAAAAQPGSALFGLIIEGSPYGTVFAKATGPAETIAAHLDSLNAMMTNLRLFVPPTQTRAAGDGARAVVGGLAFGVPADWKSEMPGEFQTRRFSIPAGIESIELGISHFGANVRGTASDNISRWLDQVPDRGNTVKSLTQDVEGLHIILVQATGTVTTSAVAKPNHTLLGAVIENGPEGMVFVKAVGPADAVAAKLDALVTFILGVRVANSNSKPNH